FLPILSTQIKLGPTLKNFKNKINVLLILSAKSIHKSRLRPALGSEKSLRIMANTTDACETRDPCQHGGICISTDSGPICECRTGDYEGAYCEKDKAPSEASFRGTEYLTIDLSKGEPVLSTQESISLQFKTRAANGLLFYSGEGDDYLTISLRDGGAAVSMSLAKGRLDLHIKPVKLRFDDRQWHKIVVHRKVQEISSITSFCRLSAIVDGVYAEHGHTAGSFTHLASDRLLVGGGADARSLQGAKGIINFVGCLRKVEFAAERIRMELIEAAKSGAAGVAAWGKMDFFCREPRTADPITFTTRDSHLSTNANALRTARPLMRFYRPQDTVVTIANPCYTGHHGVKGREDEGECTCPLKAHFAALVQELVYEHDRSCIARSPSSRFMQPGALVHPF
ncbi:Neurexin-3-alpha, partial [Trachymyrmex septentrionalis]